MNNLQKNDSPLSPHGRFGRLSYLGWNMLMGLVAIFFIIITSFIINKDNGLTPFIIMMVILYVPMLYFTFVFAIRRLHDLNQTGWLSLLILIPAINILIAIYLVFFKGTEGNNQYGEPRITQAWEKVLAWLYILVFPLGILAAISIPAYQDYVQRAKISQMQLEQNANTSE